MRACRRPTPPSSPLWGVRSISGKMLLTASSRPIKMSLLPARSKVVLSPSTSTFAALPAGAAEAALTGGAKSIGGGIVPGSAAGGAFRFAPQLLQNDSPAGFIEPQLGQVMVLPATGAGAGMVADMTAAGAASGSP